MVKWLIWKMHVIVNFYLCRLDHSLESWPTALLAHTCCRDGVMEMFNRLCEDKAGAGWDGTDRWVINAFTGADVCNKKITITRRNWYKMNLIWKNLGAFKDNTAYLNEAVSDLQSYVSASTCCQVSWGQCPFLKRETLCQGCCFFGFTNFLNPNECGNLQARLTV